MRCSNCGKVYRLASGIGLYCDTGVNPARCLCVYITLLAPCMSERHILADDDASLETYAPPTPALSSVRLRRNKLLVGDCVNSVNWR